MILNFIQQILLVIFPLKICKGNIFRDTSKDMQP